jgi:DNA invertase Pin-like site-specific DNA recombinase
MIGDGRDKYRTRKWIREHLILVRRTSGGTLECDTCGLAALTKTELADLLGIGTGTLYKFLGKQPIRQDIADKIRDSVKAVHE